MAALRFACVWWVHTAALGNSGRVSGSRSARWHRGMGIDVQLKAVVLMVYRCAASTGLACWDGRERRDPGRLGGEPEMCSWGMRVWAGCAERGISGRHQWGTCCCLHSVFIQHLLCARHRHRCWEPNYTQETQSLPSGRLQSSAWASKRSSSLFGHFSHVQLFVTPWTGVRQAPLSMGFSRQEYWV